MEKPGVKVALEMLRHEFDLALGAELGQSMNEFRKAREEIDRELHNTGTESSLPVYAAGRGGDERPGNRCRHSGKEPLAASLAYGLRETSESYGCQNSAATRAVSAAARKGSQS